MHFVLTADIEAGESVSWNNGEGFSPIGGISLSDKVHKDISSVKDIQTSFIGHKKLKGVEQETQIRCITSHNLPIIESSSFISFSGYSAYFFGIVDIFGSLHSIFTEPLTEIFTNLNFGLLGFIMIIIVYNCFSYQKGLSKTSQLYFLIATFILILFHCILTLFYSILSNCHYSLIPFPLPYSISF